MSKYRMDRGPTLPHFCLEDDLSLWPVKAEKIVADTEDEVWMFLKGLYCAAANLDLTCMYAKPYRTGERWEACFSLPFCRYTFTREE